MSERRLVEIRRRVSAEAAVIYDTAWRALESAVVGAGAHAWRFRSPDDSALHLEFIEFRASADPRTRNDVASGLRALDAIAPGSPEEWIDSAPRP